ncbi:putative RNA binding [Micractinium conductrix]|uniref:RNA binding n=1 Tax=Micractinium conductrix TaxID=554055 RepID=A0A2P6VP90_9CHLO|nr:putative RNA binding [Micractinium conductrix]|eukprot:PSC75879.1 putative RNA binding [Micractinium conductrix]
MHASARLPRAPVLRRPATARPAAAARAAGAAQPSVLRVTAGYQRPLTNQERKAKRAEAQRLGRALVTVQVGQKGLTDSFMDGLRAALLANELVKVKVGAADESLDEVAEAVQAACDCVLVHKIGFTLTLYRERGLPPAGRCAGAGAAAAVAADAGEILSGGIISGGIVRASGGGELGEDSSDGECGEDGEEMPEDAEEIDEELAAYLMEDEDAFSDSDSEGEEEVGGGGGAAAAAAAQRSKKPPPPEFTIIS